MRGYPAPGTPARYDKVGVIKVGLARAHNVLVLEPGTSAGAAYFVPLAKWIVAKAPGWQVWSVERRENLLEDQSELDLAKRHHSNSTALFDYYLGYLTDPAMSPHHVRSPSPASVAFAKHWGMRVAVGDLHRVIAAARRLHGKVVLGGHSLGGAVVTAYATWNIGGHAGASALAGLVYIDGASFRSESSAAARAALRTLDAPDASPWTSTAGFPAPLAGLLETVSASEALLYPNMRSVAQQLTFLPAALKPTVPVTNLGEYGFALNVGTSPSYLALAQAHLGRGLSSQGPVHGWDGNGALTPIARFAQMFSGAGLLSADGSEWYFPQRLTDDTLAVGNGIANPAQRVLGVDSTFGRKLPRRLLMYAFGAALGQAAVPAATVALARQSHIPRRNLILVNEGSAYAHNDPSGAYPHNAFFSHLLTFLGRVGAQR